MNLVPQFGFLELLLIAIIALIVVGPRDLPKLMRSAGRMVGKARAMASEFTSAFDQMARETEMEELRQELDALKRDNVFSKTKDEIDASLKPVEEDMRAEANALHNTSEQKAQAPQKETTDDAVEATSDAATNKS